MPLSYRYLFDNPQQVRTVANWWYTVWADLMGPDLASFESELKQSLSKTALPVHLLAYLDGKPVATAALKLHELETKYPDYQYWLGSVFVDPKYRGSRIASALTMEIVKLAQARHLPHLYLQTANLSGGLYARLAWQPVEKFHYEGEDALLMVKRLS